jgi:hypothetical protein
MTAATTTTTALTTMMTTATTRTNNLNFFIETHSTILTHLLLSRILVMYINYPC